MSSYKQTIAFFGATGGSGAACLAHALKEGHPCTALVRTPDKLINILTATHNIATGTLNTYLTIHTGSAKSSTDVRKALISPLSPKHLVDTIWSSIGSYPTFRFSLITPLALKDPSICEDGIKALFAALNDLTNAGITATHDGRKPLLIVISSTASENIWQCVPWVYVPLYYWLLTEPHVDKLNMEKRIKEDKGAHLRDFVVVRPAILTDGAERGGEHVRAGWVWAESSDGQREKEVGPAVGWSVGRKDVGAWVYKHVISRGGWEGRCVSLCY